jgi:MYXO-CTERM domain-containing protein
MTHRITKHAFPAAAALALSAGSAFAAQAVVESVPGSTFQYSGTPTTQFINFTTNQPITGVALTGDWSALAGDLGGGTYPWSLDLAANITAPGGEVGQWSAPITGDVSIIDFPIADGSGPILSGNAGPGAYQFDWFDSFGGPGSLAQVANPVYHATTTVPDVNFGYTATPDAATSWDRPFFIGGVSGLGPTSYDLLEFNVDTKGIYEFQSVLSTGGDHFTFLYAGDFDDAAPLDNLLDYGLGNGNSPFGVPRGTSSFTALLEPGTTYYWVTSTWASFSPLADSANSIVGPGAVTVVPSPGAAAALAFGALAASRRRRS